MEKPGLIRMLLINHSLLPNRIDEIPLDDHTIFLSQNMSGKTSTMTLVPFFWGAQMREIVREKNRDFISFYLPTNASYIAYEYRNHAGQVRSVVAHPSTSVTGQRTIQYRFIRGPLSQEMFIVRAGDTIVFVKNADFEAHLRSQGHKPASRLVTSTQNYRGIIQGRFDLLHGTDTVTRELVHDFGVGTRRAPLTDVEKMFLATLSNKFTLRDLLSVVAGNAVQAENTKISVLGGEKTSEHDRKPQEFEAYMAAMEKGDRFEEARVLKTGVETMREGYARTYAALKIKAGYVNTDLQASQAALRKIESKIQEYSQEKTERLSNITQRLSEIRGLLNAANTTLQNYAKQEADLLRRGADKAEDIVAGIASKTTRLLYLENELDSLMATSADAVRDLRMMFSENELKIEKALSQNENDLRNQKDSLINVHNIAVEQAREAAELEIKGSEDTFSSHYKDIEDGLIAAEHAREVAIQASMHIVVSNDLVKTVDAAKEAVILHKQQLENASQEALTARRAERVSETNFNVAEAHKKSAQNILESKDALKIKRHDELYPADGTFLSFIKKKRPERLGDLSKILYPSIFSNKNLNPMEGDDDNSIFGITLNLGSLSASITIDEEEQERLLKEAISDVEHAKQSLEEAVKATKTAAAIFHKCKEDTAKAEKIEQMSRQTFHKYENALVEAKGEVRREHDRISDIRKAELSAATVRVNGEKTRLNNAKRDHADVLNALKQKHNEKRSSLQKKHQADVDAILLRLSDVKKDAEAAIRKNKLLMQEAEQKTGIDPERIKAVQAEVQSLKSEIKFAESKRQDMNAWLSFVETIKPQMEKENAAVERFNVAITTVQQEKEQVTQAFTTTEEGLVKQKTEERTQRDRLEETFKRASGFLDVPENAPDEPCLEKGLAPSVSVQDAIDNMRELARSIKSSDLKFNSIVNRLMEELKSKEGPVSEFFRLRHDNDTRTGFISLNDWFSGEHEAIRDSILESLRIMCQPIAEAFTRLKEMNDEARNAGRRLTKQIKETTRFKNIKSVDLVVKSALTDQPFWPDFENFSMVNQKFNSDIIRDEKSVLELNEALMRLMKHWKHEGAPVIDIKDMLYVEGRLTEGNQVHELTQDTKIENVSSEGGQTVIRLILLCAAFNLIRKDTQTRFVWCVDEIGRLDRDNSKALIGMLSDHNIVLVTASPDADAKVRAEFANRISFRKVLGADGKERVSLISSGNTEQGGARNGIREWNDDEHLVYRSEVQ